MVIKMNYVQLLKKYQYYDNILRGVKYSTSFTTEEPYLIDTQFLSKYNLKEKGDFEKAIILNNIVHAILIPGNGDYGLIENECCAKIILSKTSQGLKSNCFMYCVTLAELLLMYHIPARVIICRPFDYYENTDCHCLVHAFISSKKKWVALDPANNAIFSSEEFGTLSIQELCCSIREGKAYRVNGVHSDYSQKIKDYLPQYLFCFFTFQKNAIGYYRLNANRMNALFPRIYSIPSESDKIIITSNSNEFWEQL